MAESARWDPTLPLHVATHQMSNTELGGFRAKWGEEGEEESIPTGRPRRNPASATLGRIGARCARGADEVEMKCSQPCASAVGCCKDFKLAHTLLAVFSMAADLEMWPKMNPSRRPPKTEHSTDKQQTRHKYMLD